MKNQKHNDTQSRQRLTFKMIACVSLFLHQTITFYLSHSLSLVLLFFHSLNT